MRWEVQVITGLPGLNIADIGRLKPRNKSEDESEQDTELGKNKIPQKVLLGTSETLFWVLKFFSQGNDSPHIMHLKLSSVM